MKFDFDKITCEVTGKEITRLTPKGVLSHHPYFYNKMFTNDGKKLLLASKINGGRDYYLLSLETGEALQLTENTGNEAGDGGFDADDFGGFISPDDQYMYYTKAGTFVRIDLKTLEEKLIYQGLEDWDIGGPINMSSDGKQIVMVQCDKRQAVKDQGDHWKNFLKQGKLGRRTRLVLYNMETKQERQLLDTADYEEYGLKKNQWLTHPQIRPFDNSLISYCHEGLGGTVDARIWLINSDGTNLRCARKHDFAGQIISHEFWFKTGAKLGYVRIDDAKTKESKICMIDPFELKEEVIVELPRSSHFITSHDDKYIIADGARPAEELFLYLINIEEKTYQEVVSHRSSFQSYGHGQDSHPHPSFRPDNRGIVYTSDFEGLPAVYMVEI